MRANSPFLFYERSRKKTDTKFFAVFNLQMCRGFKLEPGFDLLEYAYCAETHRYVQNSRILFCFNSFSIMAAFNTLCSNICASEKRNNNLKRAYTGRSGFCDIRSLFRSLRGRKWIIFLNFSVYR